MGSLFTNWRKLVSLVTMTCTCFAICAQKKQVTVHGEVRLAISGDLLQNASVFLFRENDSLPIGKTKTGKEGFIFTISEAGNYSIVSSFVGCHNDTTRFTVADTNVVLQLPAVELKESNSMLAEVVVSATIPPVIMKKDTLIFHAESFKTGPNATVEDLLKKLPGIEVDREGNVTINGKAVEKIYIDGKEFFLGDTKVATQSLAADMISTIEAYDYQSDRARFTRVRENTNTKTINLKLKKDKKQALIGTIGASTGSGNNYRGNTTITAFKGERWMYGNINTSYVDTRSDNTGLLQQGLNTALNYRAPVSKTSQMVFNGGIGTSRSETGQKFTRETFLSDSSLVQEQLSVNGSSANSYHIGGQFISNIDTMNTILYNVSISKDHSKGTNTDRSSIYSKKDEVVSSTTFGNTSNSIESNGVSFANNITWQRRLKKEGRTLFSSVSHRNSRQNGDGKLYSALDFFGNTDSRINDQQYDQSNRSTNIGLNIAYTEPIGEEQILNVGYVLNTVSSVSNKRSFNYNESTSKYDVQDSLTSNYLSNISALHSVNAGYNYIGRNVQYQTGVMMSYSELTTVSRGLRHSNFVQYNLNWSPSLSANYQLNRNQGLAIQYSGANTIPTADMLQPAPDISNPFLVRVGNPTLKQQFSHSVGLNYTISDSKNYTNLVIGIRGRLDNNKLAQALLLTEGGIQQVQFINLNGVYGANANIGYFLSLNRGKNGGVNITANAYHSMDKNVINGMENMNRIFRYGGSVGLNYHQAEQFFMNARAILNYSTANYSISKNMNAHNLSEIYGADITYLLPLGIHINSSFELNQVGKQRNLAGRTIAIWNASVFRIVMRNKGEVKIEAFDLLNKNTGFTQSMGSNYIESNESNVVQRYFLLTFRYRFTGNNSQANAVRQ